MLEEARFGMFDIAAYMPEDSVVDGLGESKKLSAVRACNRYQLDGTCSEKKRVFLRNFEPVYDEQCLLRASGIKRRIFYCPRRTSTCSSAAKMSSATS